jgi:hypothetical protein
MNTDGTETITLYADGLLHKYGFEDGDIMWDVIHEHGLDVDHHHLLIAVVERLVLPLLDQEVDTYTIEATLHNPIRARTVDGEDADMRMGLTPESVEIPVQAIREIAARLPPSRY